MLVLSRKKNESIIVAGNITIVIVEIHGDKVRLGIKAPKDVAVHRQEVFEAIQRDGVIRQTQAVQTSGLKSEGSNVLG